MNLFSSSSSISVPRIPKELRRTPPPLPSPSSGLDAAAVAAAPFTTRVYVLKGGGGSPAAAQRTTTMANARWSSLASKRARRWWNCNDHARICSVSAGLLLGATGVVNLDRGRAGDVQGESSHQSWLGERAPRLHQMNWSSSVPSALLSNIEHGDTKQCETTRLQSLKSFLAANFSSVALSEALPAEYEEPASPSKDVCFSRHAIADAVAKAAPAVVNITVSLGGRNPFAQTAGSGFIIHPDGTILTNAHVVADEGLGQYKGKIVVTMQDGRNFPGEIISSDSLADIAVIKVHSSKPLPAVTFGSSRKLRPGEWVVAVGSPLYLKNTVTVGIVSCVDRKSAEMGLRGVHADYIQTDAAINQGNSGGPLLNLDGDVIGINTMKALAADGVSFAIPIDSALKIIQQLNKHGRVIRPWLGMKMLGLTDDIISQLKERDASFPDVKAGVLVPQVIPGSPAARAGVHSGDVIVEFDGRPVSTPYQIVEVLDDKVGVPFKLLIKRAKGGTVTLSVITEEASPSL